MQLLRALLGIFFFIPLCDTWREIDLRILTIDVARQEMMTCVRFGCLLPTALALAIHPRFARLQQGFGDCDGGRSRVLPRVRRDQSRLHGLRLCET